MSQPPFNVDDLFRRYFNIAPRLPFFLPVPPAGSKIGGLARDYIYGIRPQDSTLPQFTLTDSFVAPDGYYLDVERSATGTPMWDRYKFQLPDTTRQTAPIFDMPDLTVADFNQIKNIVKTPVNGRNGTVKELISDGDWAVRFRGFIVDYAADAYPIDQVREMRNLFSLGAALKISSKLCNDLGIYELVCEDFSINPTDGFANVATFELACVSDMPIELEVQNA